MKKSIVTDGIFLPLVVQAGRAFVAAKEMDPSEEGKALAEFLRSNNPIGAGERELLAQLVLGEWRNMAGRPEITASTPQVIKVVERLRELINQSWQKEAAKEQAAKEFKISLATVENYDRMIREREKAVDQAKRWLSPD